MRRAAHPDLAAVPADPARPAQGTVRLPRLVPALALLVALGGPAACTRTPAPPDGGDARPPTAPAAGTHGQLARVQPPRPACLPGRPDAGPAELAARADAELRASRPAEALGCAEEALEADPREPAALRHRAWALAELDRPGEARAAAARALAARPEDLPTLGDVAAILIGRLGERDDLEAGRDHALRAASRALRPPRPDRRGAARLLVLAASAENSLGRSRDALRHAGEALRFAPGDGEALYERGVALFELCRFGEARRAFESALRRDPGDPWTLHHLGLLAERAGEDARATALLQRAARLAPRELWPPVDLDRPAFEAEVRLAVAELPEADRRALEGVPVTVEELPLLSDLTASDPPLSPSILGLFRGPSLGEPCLPSDGPVCRSVVLYRRNLARFVRDRAGLAEQVRVTLLHEVGHLRGESDDALRSRGLE
jgi:tetratricopeptide (TPR) repeat protein